MYSKSTIDKVQKLDYELLNAHEKIQQYKRKRRTTSLTPADIEELKKLKAFIQEKLAENIAWDGRHYKLNILIMYILIINNHVNYIRRKAFIQVKK